MPTYTVKSPLTHNHKRYAVGQSIELDERESRVLLVSGAVELSAAFDAGSGTRTTQGKKGSKR